METIKLENIRFKYPKSDRYIFESLNINFYQNKLNVVVGYNGAGKTTLFDIITLLLQVENGNIISIKNKNEILYQTQTANLFSALKGKDLTRFIFGTSRSKRSLDIASFNEREKELFNRLSTIKIGDMSVGERRWLLITLLTHLDKKLFIFDEPTTGVDPSSRKKILQKLHTLAQEENTTVIMSTHNLQEMAFVDCHINLLHHGEIVFNGDYNNFVSCVPTLDPDEAFEYYTETKYKQSI